MEKGESVIGTELNGFLQFINRFGKHLEAVIIQALHVMSGDGIGVGFDDGLQPVDGFLEAMMLAVCDGIGEKFIGGDAVFWIGKIAAADGGITASGESSVAQSF